MREISVSFDHEGKHYDLRICRVGPDPAPTDFQVLDNKNFYCGQLIYYKVTRTWAFHNDPGITDILAKYAIENFPVGL